MRHVTAALLLAACQPLPVDCDPAAQTGRYTGDLTERPEERFGECYSAALHIDNSLDHGAVSNGCRTVMGPVSADGCMVEWTIACNGEHTARVYLSSRQANDDGSVLDVMAQVSIRDEDGAALCLGTYDGTLTRTPDRGCLGLWCVAGVALRRIMESVW